MAPAPALEDRPTLVSLFAVPDVQRARAYRAARVHSRFVRFARLALPLGFVAAVAGLGLAAFAPWRPAPGVEFTVESIGMEGGAMTMARPKLSGFRRDGRPFTLVADKAVQDVADASKAALTGVSGEMAVSDAMRIRLAAGRGRYDNATQRLQVEGGVRLSGDDFEMTVDAADIDFKGGAMASNDRVIVVRKDGSEITADGFVAANNGHQLTFSGHVRTTIRPSGDDQKGNSP
jgi:lipopolysaccharide export system protein LptC